MKTWILKVGCLLVWIGIISSAGTVLSAGQAEDCAAGRPFNLTAAVTPVVGKTPLWLTWGKGALKWNNAEAPLEILFVRDRTVTGAAIVSGKSLSGSAKVTFGKFGSTVAVKQDRFQLDNLGTKLKTASPTDLQKYSFNLVNVYFPEPGCYELSARVGREQATIVMNVPKPTGK